MRIGVIGSGIAGLVASRELSEAGHQVTLFERQATIGMDAHSLEISNEAGTFAIARADVPSRMFNAAQWPYLSDLYQRIGVDAVEVSTSQSFSEFGGNTYLKLIRSTRLAAVAGTLLNGKAKRILRCAQRLQSQGARDLENGLSPSRTTLEYLYDGNYANEFIYGFLYPTLSSTICTCSYQSLNAYPAVTILSILNNLTQDPVLLRTLHGTRDAAQRLLVNSVKLRLRSDVQKVERVGNEVHVFPADEVQPQSFDHLIVATQANTAVGLVPQIGEAERSVLGSFQYESIPIYVHTDRRFMPRKKQDWATFNMLVDSDTRAAMCSVWLNRFHSEWEVPQPVFQTINAFSQPNADLTIGYCVLQRPVVNHESIRAWEAIAEMNRQPDRRIWFCGSYAGRGTPLLESGVASAMSVVEAIRKTLADAA